MVAALFADSSVRITEVCIIIEARDAPEYRDELLEMLEGAQGDLRDDDLAGAVAPALTP